MAELLEIVEGVDAVPSTKYWSLPQSFVQKASRSSIQGESLIEGVKYTPSRQSQLFSRFKRLCFAPLTITENRKESSMIFDNQTNQAINFPPA